MKIIALVILFICSKASIAQDYYRYYEAINKAKLSIIENNHSLAISYYYDTFEKFEFVFARDCFNALEISCLLEDFDKVDYFLKRCLKQGIEIELLEQESFLNDFIKTDAWLTVLSTKDSLRNIYENNVNWEIRNEINSMFTADQEIRDLVHKNRFNIFRIRKLNKEFEEIDHQLVLRLLEITKKYGFPGEKLIGLDMNRMHPKVIDQHLSAGMPIIILIHHYSQPNKSYNSLLIDEIRKGNLFNEHFATISDFQYTYGK